MSPINFGIKDIPDGMNVTIVLETYRFKVKHKIIMSARMATEIVPMMLF